ncbi:MAG: type IV pilus modification protein PilV [Burkholderiales bacterium]
MPMNTLLSLPAQRGAAATNFRPGGRKAVCESGFTLLEVLISLLILSFGLLGLAGLQAHGLRNNHSAYLRSQASLLAYDMSDRMRANAAGRSSYNNISSATAYTDPGCITSASGCTPIQVAQYDAYSWVANLAAGLPSGTGTVKQGAASGTTDCAGNAITDTATYVVTVNWAEISGNTSTTKCLSLPVRPQ